MFQDSTEDRLTRYYESVTDDALLRLAGTPQDMTELAQQLVIQELRRRHIQPPDSSKAIPDDAEYSTGAEAVLQGGSQDVPALERQLWEPRPGDYAELAPPECVFPISEQMDTFAIRVTLALAQIPYDEFWPRPSGLDMRAPFFAVLPEDRDRARQLLCQPVSEEVTTQMALQEADDDDDWTPPSCPRCGAPDALLTSVTPTNTWNCEECNHIWVDE